MWSITGGRRRRWRHCWRARSRRSWVCAARSRPELGDQAGRFELGPLPLPGLRLTSWAVGAAVRENARDLGYAAGDVLAAAVKDGTVGRIFQTHGIAYQRPPLV